MKPPVKFTGTPSNIRRHPPRLGEHTQEVLAELSETQEAPSPLPLGGEVG